MPAPSLANDFSVLVSTVGQRPQVFVFDQDKVVVGRGMDCDLRVEHAGMSRTQFLLERGLGSQGESRFRITPFESTNPTLVNERPAVEGTIVPGDIIAVSEIRITLQRQTAAERQRAASKKRDAQPAMAPLRMVLIAATVFAAAWLGYLFWNEGNDLDTADIVAAKLFLPPTEQRCTNPTECTTRARDAYTKGKAYYAQANADPGNLYRAALEFERCKSFLSQLPRPVDDMTDLDSFASDSKRRAEIEFADAQFRLSRASASGDRKRARIEADLLSRMVPDDRHPFRIKLDARRRSMPKDDDK